MVIRRETICRRHKVTSATYFLAEFGNIPPHQLPFHPPQGQHKLAFPWDN